MSTRTGRYPTTRPTVTATLAAILVSIFTPAAAATGQNAGHNATGSLNVGRFGHTATLLDDGTVLVAGGLAATGDALRSETYDPETGTWSAAGDLTAIGPSVRLRDGSVLVAGSFWHTEYVGSNAQIYDPATRAWRSTGALTVDRSGHTATLLTNGKVLVAGGMAARRRAEIYDPETGTWSRTGSLTKARVGHTATLLADGTVLVAGGGFGDPFGTIVSAEVYDPRTGAWRAVGPLRRSRMAHTATLLPDGRVLVVGGYLCRNDGYSPRASAELYDPATEQWTRVDDLPEQRAGHTATLMPDGTVLIAGGGRGTWGVLTPSRFASVLRYDPEHGTWTAAADLATGRAHHTATLLTNGTMLVAGGRTLDRGTERILDLTELYDSSYP